MPSPTQAIHLPSFAGLRPVQSLPPAGGPESENYLSQAPWDSCSSEAPSPGAQGA